MTTDPVSRLPPELSVEIFAFLDPQWQSFLANDVIWRKVAIRLGLCPEINAEQLKSLESLQTWSATSHFRDVSNFQQLCTVWQRITDDWRGEEVQATLCQQDRPELLEDEEREEQAQMDVSASSDIRSDSLVTRRIRAKHYFLSVRLVDDQLDIWRIKVDPEDGTLIATTRSGGLFVIDIATNRILWHLSVHDVGLYKHLEGEKGILVMNSSRMAGFPTEEFDVWVHRRLISDGGNQERYQRRATLEMTQNTRASRFKYPTFCAMGTGGLASFWDLSDPEHPRQLPSVDASVRHGHWSDITYVDFDDQHLFLVGKYLDQVSVYDRATGQIKWSMAAYLRQENAIDLIRSYDVELSPFLRAEGSNRFEAEFEFLERRLRSKEIDPHLVEAIENLFDPTIGRGRWEWEAIHPDESTGALLVLGRRMLVIIPNFATLTESACRVPIMTVEYRKWGIAIAHGQPSAFNDMVQQLPLTVADGRALVVEAYHLLFDLVPDRTEVLQPGSHPFKLPEDSNTPPNLRIYAARTKMDELSGDENGVLGCSCAQMDAANIFAVVPTAAPWYDDAEEEHDLREALYEVSHWRIGSEERRDPTRSGHGRTATCCS
ncbi:hypothetical protein OC861_004712 [Tilletia horrida]|nr:hypothetical protein OC845_004960 [Tilletia horrida]KAK0563598.1 hypothetical protein OC861_004712 [Tilletia horrida]